MFKGFTKKKDYFSLMYYHYHLVPGILPVKNAFINSDDYL